MTSGLLCKLSGSYWFQEVSVLILIAKRAIARGKCTIL